MEMSSSYKYSKILLKRFQGSIFLYPLLPKSVIANELKIKFEWTKWHIRYNEVSITLEIVIVGLYCNVDVVDY